MAKCDGATIGAVCKKICTKTLSIAFEYDTPKYVHVRNKKVGLLYRTGQLVVFAFIGVFLLWYEGGYRDRETVQGTVVTKVKGVYRTNGTGLDKNAGNLTWDDPEYVVPSKDSAGNFFVMTNMWITERQTDGVCPENPRVESARCDKDGDCPEGRVYRQGHGVANGSCNNNTHTCFVKAWCPVEEEDGDIVAEAPKILANNFTVLIKNSILFPRLSPQFTARNLPKNLSLLDTCRYDSSSSVNKSCPLFTLQQLVDMMRKKYEFNELATEGAVVAIRIIWNCDLNWGSCDYGYETARVDAETGYNFRFARYWFENGIQYRQLIKAYGIQFEVQVVGDGYLVSAKSIFITLGSGLAYLAIAQYITDFFVLYCLKKASIYRKHKYHKLNQDKKDGFVLIEEDSVSTSSIQEHKTEARLRGGLT